MENYVHSMGGNAKSKKIRDNYNKNPNFCKYCGKPLLYDGTVKLADVKRKKFCNSSCSASYNNQNRSDIKFGVVAYKKSKICGLSDDYIIDCYFESANVSDFMQRLGMNSTVLTTAVIYKLNELHLDVEDLKNRYKLSYLVNKVTKGELKDKYGYQGYRSFVQRYTRITYTSSNLPKKCCVCGYDKHIEIAHVKSVSSFSDDTLIKDINNLQNLKALCPNHHWEYDNGELLL